MATHPAITFPKGCLADFFQQALSALKLHFKKVYILFLSEHELAETQRWQNPQITGDNMNFSSLLILSFTQTRMELQLQRRKTLAVSNSMEKQIKYFSCQKKSILFVFKIRIIKLFLV